LKFKGAVRAAHGFLFQLHAAGLKSGSCVLPILDGSAGDWFAGGIDDGTAQFNRRGFRVGAGIRGALDNSLQSFLRPGVRGNANECGNGSNQKELPGHYHMLNKLFFRLQG
jgi:hypothetical protein